MSYEMVYIFYMLCLIERTVYVLCIHNTGYVCGMWNEASRTSTVVSYDITHVCLMPNVYNRVYRLSVKSHEMKR